MTVNFSWMLFAFLAQCCETVADKNDIQETTRKQKTFPERQMTLFRCYWPCMSDDNENGWLPLLCSNTDV